MYEIAEGGNTKELKAKVNELMDKGYKPILSITITSWVVGKQRFWLLCQPMTKEEK
jgi:hypothetical protein